MKYIVYKSLDKPSSLFGIKGSYLNYAIGGVVVAAMIGFITGQATNGLVGMLVFIAGIVAVYVIILRIQAKFSEKERTKWFCSHKLPQYIVMHPKSIRKYTAATFKKKSR